ncbi:hypothetical protein HY636_01565 [Candidatus Woesearchaeota archaeon]|nr:hypothetical protein [Candidatus Woesearchaeota archaeon]
MNLTNIIHNAEEYANKALSAVGFTAASVILAYTSLTALPSNANAQQSNKPTVSIPDVRSSLPTAVPSRSIYSDEDEGTPLPLGQGVYINGKLVQRKLTAEEKAALKRAERDTKAAEQGKMPYCDTLPASCTSKKIGKYNKQPKVCENYHPRGRYYAGNGKVDFTNDMKCQDSDPKMNWQDWLKGWYNTHKQKKQEKPAQAVVPPALPAVGYIETGETKKVTEPVVEQPQEPTIPAEPQEPTAGQDKYTVSPTFVFPTQRGKNAVSFGYKQIIRGNDKNDTFLVEVGYDRALGRFILGARALVGAQYPNVSSSEPEEKGATVPNPQSLDQMFSREYTYKTTSEGKGMLDTFGLQAVAGLNVYQKDDGSFGLDVLLKGGAVAVLTEIENRSLVQAVQSPNYVLSQKSAPTSTNNEARWYPDFGGEIRFNLGDNYFLGLGGGVTGVNNPQGNVNANAGFRF